MTYPNGVPCAQCGSPRVDFDYGLFVYIEDEKRNKDGTRSRMVTIEMPPSNQLLHAEPVEEILATRSRRASCYFSKQVEQACPFGC